MSWGWRASDSPPPEPDPRRAGQPPPYPQSADGASAPAYVHPPAWQGPTRSHHVPYASSYAPGYPSPPSSEASPYWEDHQRMQTVQHAPGRDRRDRVRQLEGECLDSLQSSLRVVAETNEVSQRTAVQLDAQSEQLRGIKNTTEDIHADLQTSDYLLKGMKTWWGSFTQLFTSPPAPRSAAGVSSAERKAGTRKGENRPEREREEAAAQEERRQQRLVQAHRARTSDFDARLEGDLEKLSVMVGPVNPEKDEHQNGGVRSLRVCTGTAGWGLEELHGRAVQMNGALQEQNSLLDEINQNVDANQQTLERQRQTMQKIIKKG
uniref:Synaptosomal-associated protein 25, putative n=1 Tax=Neospora caninum (strain Liverpool) TaxID=572307 RepID=A0A0F7U5V6_NEOCL|nr:TPA: synaptosomal-associated protein 25, putative [Neospora caninum Liverpool]